MIITPLGHTEFLVDIANSECQNVRILVDGWLSDYALGDLMERTVKVKLDHEKLSTINALYISHAHCDHFDPYTLVELYKHANPTLILPFTLRYLEGLIHEYLPSADVVWLEHRKPYLLHGIEITGYMWANPVITNEDDVMMLAISSERELVFAEIDTVPDMEDEGVQKSLYKVFTRKNYETACYLASRNCLEGQIPYYDTARDKRKAYRDQYVATQKEEIAFQYERYEYEEFAHHPNLYALPGFVRGFIGQGIAYPSVLSDELYALALLPLDEIVSLENDFAKNAGYSFPQKALTPGRQYKVENGGIEVGRKECPIAMLEKSPIESNQGKNERIYSQAPLIPRELSETEILEGKKKILEILNTRFLPYWSASPVASLRDALIKNNGTYSIELRMKNDEGRIVFEYSTAGTGFIEVPYRENISTDEDYWFLDVLDFIEGKLEMYSSFWQVLDPKKIYRLWTCLGANYMNSDLVEKKYRYHFEQAKAGKTATEFVEGILKNL